MDDLERAFEEIHEALVAAHARCADLEARIERMFRKGVVTDIDATNMLYRQQIGLDDSGGVVKSPWLPYSQVAGGRKFHSMPAVGEQYLLVNPDGSSDFTQGLGIPHGWCTANPTPSNNPAADVAVRGATTDTTTATSRVIQVGGTTLTLVDGTLTISAGGVSLVVSSAGVAVTGGMVTHQSLDIGATHVHGGVMAGPANTGVPNP